MRVGAYTSNYILFWINAIAAPVIALNIAKLFKRIFRNNLVNRYLQSIGKNSIIYVCLNQIVIMLCGDIIYFFQ